MANESSFIVFDSSKEVRNWKEFKNSFLKEDALEEKETNYRLYTITPLSLPEFNNSLLSKKAYFNETLTTNSLKRDEDLAKVEVAVLALIFILTVIGNCVVLLGIFFRRQKMSRMYYFILHLSIADLITAFFNVLTQLCWEITYRFQGGNFLCKFVKYSQILGPYSSSYVLVMTALDRYQAICNPLSNCSWTAKRSKVMLAIAWSISLFCCIPQLFIFSYQLVKPATDTDSEEYDCWATFPENGAKVYVTWYSITVFIIPLTILVFAYTCITRAIWINFNLKSTDRNRYNFRKKNFTGKKCLRKQSCEDEGGCTQFKNNVESRNHNRIKEVSMRKSNDNLNVIEKFSTVPSMSGVSCCKMPIGRKSVSAYCKKEKGKSDCDRKNSCCVLNESCDKRIVRQEADQDQFRLIPLTSHNNEYKGDKNEERFVDGSENLIKFQKMCQHRCIYDRCNFCRSTVDNRHLSMTTSKTENNIEAVNGEREVVEHFKPFNGKSKSFKFSRSRHVSLSNKRHFSSRNKNRMDELNVRGSSIRQSVKSSFAEHQPRTHSVKGISRAKIKTIKLTVTIICCYVVCSCPFIAAQLWSVYDPNAYNSTFFTGPTFTILTLLASLNSCVNPYIFLFFNPNLLENCFHGIFRSRFPARRQFNNNGSLISRGFISQI